MDNIKLSDSEFKRIAIQKDYEPVIHECWVPFHSQAAGNIWYCSACEIGFITRMNYCPNCGAKMDCMIDSDNCNNLFELETNGDWDGVKAWAAMPKYKEVM